MRTMAGLLTLLIQLIILGAVFFEGLLDPLLGILVVGFYFFVVGSFLTYSYLLNQLKVIE